MIHTVATTAPWVRADARVCVADMGIRSLAALACRTRGRLDGRTVSKHGARGSGIAELDLADRVKGGSRKKLGMSTLSAATLSGPQILGSCLHRAAVPWLR